MGFLGQLGRQMLTVLLPTLATAIGGMIMALLKQQLTKQGLQLTAEQERRIDQIVSDAIRIVEEEARRQTDKMPGPQKAARAEQIIRQKLPDLSDDRLRQVLDRNLPLVRRNLEADTIIWGN